MTVSSKVRIYDLAKELKLDTKRLIEEVRREGVDVSVPSNSVSKELAEKIRNKYFPKKETAVKRGVRVVKRAERAVEEPPAEVAEVPVAAEPVAEVIAESAQPEVVSPVPVTEAVKPPTTTAKLRKLTPAARAEQPVLESAAPATSVELPTEVEETNGNLAESAALEPNAAPSSASIASTTTVPPPSRQVK